jgi:hypothetical protein
MGRFVAAVVVPVILAACAGCGLGPRNFRKINHPAPLMRARAMSLGYEQPDSMVLPALISRLDDSDVVVRMAANEELKRRTGHDFGYVPWASPEERASAGNAWHAWLTGQPVAKGPTPAQARKTLPRPSPQGSQGQ